MHKKNPILYVVLVVLGIMSVVMFQNCSEVIPLTSQGDLVPEPEPTVTDDEDGDGGNLGGDEEGADEESDEEYCARIESQNDPFFTPPGWTFHPEAWTDAFEGRTIPSALSVAPYVPIPRTGYTGTKFTLPAGYRYTTQFRSGGDAHGYTRSSGMMMVVSKCQGDFRQYIPNPDLAKHPWESPNCRTVTVATSGYGLSIHETETGANPDRNCVLPPGEYFYNVVYGGWGPGFMEPACPPEADMCTRAFFVGL